MEMSGGGLAVGGWVGEGGVRITGLGSGTVMGMSGGGWWLVDGSEREVSASLVWVQGR